MGLRSIAHYANGCLGTSIVASKSKWCCSSFQPPSWFYLVIQDHVLPVGEQLKKMNGIGHPGWPTADP